MPPKGKGKAKAATEKGSAGSSSRKGNKGNTHNPQFNKRNSLWGSVSDILDGIDDLELLLLNSNIPFNDQTGKLACLTISDKQRAQNKLNKYIRTRKQQGRSPVVKFSSTGTEGPGTYNEWQNLLSALWDLRRKCRRQLDDGQPIPVHMGGQGSKPTDCSVKYWPRLQSDIEDCICEELAVHPEYGFSEPKASAWFRGRSWTVDGYSFKVLVGDHFQFLQTRSLNDAFSNWDTKMIDRGLPVPRNKATWGLRSWRNVNPDATVPNKLISHEDERYHERFAEAALGILASLAETPLFSQSQATSIAWECYGVALQAKDAHLLWELCGKAMERSAKVSNGTDVVSLKLFPSKNTTFLRTTIATLKTIFLNGKGPIPPVPQPIQEVWNNTRAAHFRLYDPMTNVALLHLAGRLQEDHWSGIATATPSEREEIKQLIRSVKDEDEQDILNLGCAEPACVYGPNSAYRPETGMRCPYASEKQEKRMLCCAHFQAALFSYKVLKLSFEQYRLALDDPYLLQLGGGLESLAATAQVCQGTSCLATTHSLWYGTLDGKANCGGVAFTQCWQCSRRSRSSFYRQTRDIEAKAKKLGKKVEDLPAKDRVVRTPSIDVLARFRPCADQNKGNAGCLGVTGHRGSERLAPRNPDGGFVCHACFSQYGNLIPNFADLYRATLGQPVSTVARLVKDVAACLAKHQDDDDGALEGLRRLSYSFFPGHVVSINCMLHVIRRTPEKTAIYVSRAMAKRALVLVGLSIDDDGDDE